MKRWGISILIILLLLAASFTFSADFKPTMPSPKDRCAVCGMFVAKYPNFLAQVLFQDGSYAFFDGPKDMFKYYFDVKKYNPSKKPSDVAAIYVIDYYSLSPVDGFKAYYVEGSNVFGPMGKELIPFEKEAEAKEFMADHVGKSLLRFKEVSPEILKGSH